MFIAEHQTQDYSTDLLEFQFSGVRITSLAHEKCPFKIIFGLNYFTSESVLVAKRRFSHVFVVVFHKRKIFKMQFL